MNEHIEPSAMTENKDHDKLFADLDAVSEQQIEVGLAAGVWNEQVRPLVQHYLYDLKLKRVEAAAGRLTEMEKAVRGHIGLTYIPIPFSKNVRSRNLVPSQFAPLRASLGDAGPALFLVAYRERRFVERPRPLAVRDLEVLRLA